jgi:hypothetical protein
MGTGTYLGEKESQQGKGKRRRVEKGKRRTVKEKEGTQKIIEGEEKERDRIKTKREGHKRRTQMDGRRVIHCVLVLGWRYKEGSFSTD